MNSEDIILIANPLIKGTIDLQNKVSGKLVFGRMWSNWESNAIEKEINSNEINFIWNLMEKPHGNISNAEEIWTPIDDFEIPSNKDSFLNDSEKIIKLLKSGKNILVHCFGGKGRTSMALAVVMTKLGMKAEDALSSVFEIANGPETDEQKDFVRNIKGK